MFVGIIVGEMDPEEGNLVPVGDCNVEGPRLNFVEGLSDMIVDGVWLAEMDGNVEGATVGYLEGTIDGDIVGRTDGYFDGRTEGYKEGLDDNITPSVSSC